MFKWASFVVAGVLFFGSAVFSYAGAIGVNYNSSNYTGNTGLSNDVGTVTKYLYIDLNANVSTSNPAGGNDVYLYAQRYREKKAILVANNIREQVTVQGGADGVSTTYLSAGATVNENLNFGGGNLLYKFDATNPGDTYSSFSNKYVGFRITDAIGDIYYGWAKISGFIKTEAAAYDLNQASVSILDVAVADTANIALEAGQTSFAPIDTITTTADWTWGNNGSYSFNINNSTGSAGTNWSLFDVNDLMTISATSSEQFTIDIASLTAGGAGGDADGFDGSNGTVYEFLLVDAVSSIADFDVDKFLLDTTGFTNDVQLDWDIVLGSDDAISSGDSSQIWLTATVVPEPSTLALISLGVISLIRRRVC